MATIIDIADAVAAVINSVFFPSSAAAAREYVPVRKKMALTSVSVPVVPVALERSLLTRAGSSLTTYQIDVGVLQQIGPGEMQPSDINAACDPLMGLAEQIADTFYGKGLSGVPGCVCVDVKNTPIFSPSHLDEERTFLGLLTLHFKLGG